MQRLTISAQIDAVFSAQTYVTGGAMKARPSERQEINRRLSHVIRTLQWLAENEDRLRASIGAPPA